MEDGLGWYFRKMVLLMRSQRWTKMGKYLVWKTNEEPTIGAQEEWQGHVPRQWHWKEEAVGRMVGGDRPRDQGSFPGLWLGDRELRQTVQDQHCVRRMGNE